MNYWDAVRGACAYASTGQPCFVYQVAGSRWCWFAPESTVRATPDATVILGVYPR